LEPIREIEEHLREGAPLPTNNHVVLEGFDRYLIVHACFGEVVNRTLGGIFDSILSERELITGWWADGYRILIDTPNKLTRQKIDKLPEALFHLSDGEVEQLFKKYIKAKFPFAYKMKFVAERFGALPRGKTMSYERQLKLRSAFEKTPIYDETLRESMLEKADLQKTKLIMQEVASGKIALSTFMRTEKPSPLAYHILAQYSDISELMAPERVVLNNIDKMKNVLDAKNATLVCINCGTWKTKAIVKNLLDEPRCENCNSRLLTLLYSNQNAETIMDYLRRRRKGEELAPEELKELTQARRKADLILSYGKQAIRALQVKGVGPEAASRILGKMHPKNDDFYLDLLKAKIQYLRTREFWDT
jgi:ATP-dependent helicase Lhr and Lhr-like helicase